jgi:CarD family transcriptional regulator
VVDEPARRLRHAQHPDEEGRGRQGADGEHDAPDAVEVPERRAEDRVDHERRELPDDDRDLVAPRERAADLVRRELGEVHGHDGGRAAHREAQQHAAHHEHLEHRGDHHDDGAEEEEDREREDRRAPAAGVGDASAHERAERRREHERRGRDALGDRREPELLRHRQQRAVDDAGVVAEEQATEARDDRHEAQPTSMRSHAERRQRGGDARRGHDPPRIDPPSWHRAASGMDGRYHGERRAALPPAQPGARPPPSPPCFAARRCPERREVPVLQTEVGSILVYPRHGAVTVTATTTREVGGAMTDVVHLQTHSSDLQIQVPRESLELVGVREVSAGEELRAVYGTLQESMTEEPANWSRRFKANTEKMGSGSIVRIAEVVRDLWRRLQEKPLSPGEKSMYERARQLLVSELALTVDAHSVDEAEALLDTVLAGGAIPPAKR